MPAVAVMVGALASQLDKIILPSSLSPEIVGRYALISGLGLALAQLQYPLHRALVPYRAKLLGAYHRNEGRQIYLSIVIACGLPAFVIVLFSSQIVHIWLKTGEDVSDYAILLRCAAIATFVNAIYGVRYVEFLVGRNYSLILLINVGGLGLAYCSLLAMLPSWGILAGAAAILLIALNQFICSIIFGRKTSQ